MESRAPLLEQPRPALPQAPGRWGTSAFVGFLAALQFLTIVPPLIRRMFTATEMGHAVGYFPMVGLLLGGFFLGLDQIFSHTWQPALSAALVLVTWVLLTGALHLDGFLD